MERIMMTLFPYNMVLNPRVGPDQLAIKLAKVFGVDYVPEKPKSKLINEIKPKITNKRKKHLYLANTIDNHRKPKVCLSIYLQYVLNIPNILKNILIFNLYSISIGILN